MCHVRGCTTFICRPPWELDTCREEGRSAQWVLLSGGEGGPQTPAMSGSHWGDLEDVLRGRSLLHIGFHLLERMVETPGPWLPPGLGAGTRGGREGRNNLARRQCHAASRVQIMQLFSFFETQ